MATAQFGRVITAMITPFTEDGAVDYESAVATRKSILSLMALRASLSVEPPAKVLP